MLYGWAGTNLEIDLSSGRIEKVEGNPRLYGEFLGGRGTNTKTFWDRVSPETAPLSPENLLIFGAGLLTGTLAPAANRTVVTTRSPVTGLLTYSSMGGFFAPELKYAGYDSVILSGKSHGPVYLSINNDSVEIRDATHLWGKDTTATSKIIREELKSSKVQIVCIGPAGENKVSAANIEHSNGASASRTGVGAIMGDKKLKAIAVCGTKDISIAKPSKFVELCEAILKRSGKLKAFVDDYSHNRVTGHLNGALYGNMGESIPWPEAGDIHAELLKKFRVKSQACYNCGISCRSAMRLPSGEISFVKCFSWFLFMTACKIPDFLFNLECYHLCERLGLDSASTASIIAFAIDLYEKGILSKEDTDGMELQWGNRELAFSLIEKIARREGIGDILAHGVYEAARMIGKGAQEHAHTVKKLELYPFPLYTPFMAYTTALSDRADLVKNAGEVLQHRLPTSKESKEEYLKSGYFPYPKEFEKYIWDTVDWTGADYERQSKLISYDGDKINISDCSGLCIYWTTHWPFEPIQLGDNAKLISYATGMDIDENGSLKIAQRIGNLFRSYNVILGLKREDDTIPQTFFRNPPAPPKMLLDRGRFDKMVSEYYRLRGWNGKGVPTKETLGDLGLDGVSQELERRGIL